MKPRKIALFLFLSAFLHGEPAGISGIDPSTLDRKCQPCEDFWRFANGGWLDKNPIPARHPRWGTFMVLRDANRERLQAILEAAQKASPGSEERKIGDFYSSCMDTPAIEARGSKPLDADFARVAAIRSAQDLAAVLTEFQRYGRIGPFGVAGLQDSKKSTDVIVTIAPGGLSLPDRDYYFKTDEKSKQIREQFLKHAANLLSLLGDKPEAAAGQARRILDFETSLAGATMTNVARRDPYARYHKMDLAAVNALTPAYDWKPVFAGLAIAESSPVNVLEPEFLKKVDAQFSAVPLDDWKTWLRWRVLSLSADHLAKAFVGENFAFNQTVLTGVKVQLPRAELCTALLDGTMGEPLGRLFVARHFPPDSRRRVNELVENLRATLREQLANSDWLAPETRTNAAAKLEAFAAKIGYPDKWRDYSALPVDRSDYFTNVRQAIWFDRAWRLAKIGKPVDRTEWGMTPPTVNAYYNPLRNEIAFPAGILQPPFFDPALEDGANYAAIGAVIGHEMGHGFDDQGSKFDASGNLKNWWTDQDRKQFDSRAQCVIDQFESTDIGGGMHHTGKLVVGEAMGDLGGLALAYKAWKRSLRGKPEPPVIDGFTADQRFFLAFARIWADANRPEQVRLLLATNPHPLGKYRTNLTLQNLPEFRRAFHCNDSDPMVRPAEKQCKLW